jgi:membrane protein YqaA with SNARE-associated domain
MKIKETKKVIRFTSVFIALLILAILIYSLVNITTIEEETSSLIKYYGVPALFIISIFLDLIPQYISPVVALAAAIISGINVYYATIAIILGSTIGSTIGYTIGKKYLFNAVDILATKKSTKKLTRLTNDYGKIIIPLAAVSPIPYLPVVIGAIQFSKRNFIIYGLIPRALSLAIYAYLFSII